MARAVEARRCARQPVAAASAAAPPTSGSANELRARSSVSRVPPDGRTVKSRSVASTMNASSAVPTGRSPLSRRARSGLRRAAHLRLQPLLDLERVRLVRLARVVPPALLVIGLHVLLRGAALLELLELLAQGAAALLVVLVRRAVGRVARALGERPLRAGGRAPPAGRPPD